MNADEIATGLAEDQRLFLEAMTISGPIVVSPANEEAAGKLCEQGLLHIRDGLAELSELGQQVASLVALQDED